MVFLGLLMWILYKISTHIMEIIQKRREILWPDYEDKAWQAQLFHWSIWNKIKEMEKDPFTSEADWRKLLPVCRFADEWFAQTHPHVDFLKKENMVRSLMD